MKHQRIAVHRMEPCRMCGCMEAVKIAETDFWDLQLCNLVACSQCNLIQLDPMLTPRSIQLGCDAYYHFERMHTSISEQHRNLIRNFRRGILFASQLQSRGFSPHQVLEFGPGTGHFTAGIKLVFPSANVTVVDIVDEVLSYNANTHNFTTVKGSPETMTGISGKGYDLVIARDVIEHVTDIGQVIKNISNLLNPGGLFHFSTPNGKEDVWKHIVNWNLRKGPSELLINHVNYFDGKGLRDFLHAHDLNPVSFYTYKIKTTLKGKGWKLTVGLSAPISTKRSTDSVQKKEPMDTGQNLDLHGDSASELVANNWYLKTQHSWIRKFICWYMHEPLLKLNPDRNMGHEMFGIFIKRK